MLIKQYFIFYCIISRPVMGYRRTPILYFLCDDEQDRYFDTIVYLFRKLLKQRKVKIYK